jgi:glycosyltransferase involved in cell wall biosynthesis
MNSVCEVSIIVPVYNAEPYIRECLDSLQAQTLKNFEALLVDDGSTDRSGSICDEYAGKDARFKVFHYENGGVSMARQRGLDHASGEFTIHVDPDDWVDKDMLECLVSEARRTGADMVMCDFYEESLQDTRYVSQNPGEDWRAETILRKILFQQLHGSCWNKLLRRVCCNSVKFTPPPPFMYYRG